MGLNFSQGFTGSTSLLTDNGSTKLSGTGLQLTDGGILESASAFSTNPIDVTHFATQFTFQIINTTSPGADGFTFTIQGVSPTALGSSGGELGYGGIPSSVAIKFDLYSNLGEGFNSTGLYTGGADPTIAGSIDLSGSGIDLHDQDVFNAALTYDGTTLRVTITDTVTGAAASQSYLVNIPAVVGGNTAYVGFTAGTGDNTASQTIQSWTYSPTSLIPPAAPATLAAAGGTNQVTLNWAPSAGATTYNIYRATSPGAEGAIPYATGVTSTSFIDPSAASGTTYYYQVTAANASGASPKSTEASAITTPAAPANVMAVGGTNQVSLTWGASLGASSYNIYRATSPGAEGLTPFQSGITTTSFLNTGLGAGVTYYYQVTAVDTSGESGKSVEASAMTASVIPTTVTAVGGINQVSLTWSASLGATSYNIYRATSSGAEGLAPFQTGITKTSFLDTSVTAGTTYYYQVTAVNAGSESGRSSEASATTAPATPATLTGVGGINQVSLTWSASLGAATYSIYRAASPGAEGTTPYRTGITSTSFLDTGLASGTTYYYQITAVNPAGESSKSAETSATPVAVGLNFGSGFAKAGGSLDFNGAAKINGTALELTDGGTGEAASAFSATRIDVTRFSTQFTFQILNTTNPSADGFTFAIQGAGPTALGPGGGGLGYGPDSPGNGVGIPNSVAIKFDLYSNAGEGNDSTGLFTNGAPPTNVGSIDLTSTGVNLHSQHVFNVLMTYDGTTLKVTITDTATNVSASQSYTVNIPAVIGGSTGYVGFTGGTGGLTAMQSILTWIYTPSTPAPSAPTGLSATATGSQISLTWAASTGATSYNVYRSSTSGGEGLTPLRTGMTGTSFVDTGVASGGRYFYQVSAVGAGGESAKSVEASATLIPAVPTNVSATASASQVTLTWTASSGATSYRVYRGLTSGAEGSTPFQAGLTSPSFTDTAVNLNTTYYYQVTAVNAAGESGRSLEVSATTPKPGLNFSGGFSGAATQLTLNQSAKINGSALQLTDGGTSETASAFSTARFDITKFTTQFNFQLLSATADGFTFTIQGVAANVVGGGGGLLGYGGLSKSVAVKFDIYNNAGEGTSSTGLYSNGATPENVGSINLTPAGINLRSGHVFSASMTYDGATLKITITDTSTNVSASQSYSVNIPAIIGGNTAFIGFTGASGGLTAIQKILSWTYSLPSKPAVPTGFTATAGAQQVMLSWAASAGATTYNVYRSTTSGGEGATPVSTGVTATSFTDTGLTAGTTYYYQVTAVNAQGESGKSNEASATPTSAPGLNFSSGFASAGGVLTLNGAAKVNGTALQLTDGGSAEAASVFSTSAVNVSSFSTQFSFQLQDTTNPGADGFTFCIQGVGPTALGLSGGAMGYGTDAPGDGGGIAKSVAVKFKLYNSVGEGNDSTGLLTNGGPPTTVNSVDLTNTGINLHNGDVFNVAMTYDGTTLKVTITDTVTQATASQSYAVNIPSLVGGNTAYVGFTGGTGGLTAVQKILNWTYTPG